MTSFQQRSHQHNSGVSYEIINNFCVSEPSVDDLKSKLKRNYTVVFYLAVLAILSFGAVFTFSSMMKRFHTSSCFLDTEFQFNHPEDVIPGTENPVVVEKNSSSVHSFEFLTIDRETTMWSRHDKCDPVTYPPVVMGMSAIIWASMFYVCSMTDRNHKSLIPNPWRIVLPAFLYFALMAILSIFYSIKVHGYLNDVCLNMQRAVHVDSISMVPSCRALMDQLVPSEVVKTSVLYLAFLICTDAALFFWILVTTLMLIRCLFAEDFQRTAVDIKPLSIVSVPESQ